MNPSELENLIAAWVSNDLPPGDERKLDSFLAEHPNALAEVAHQRSVDAALRVMFDGADQRVVQSVTGVLRAKSREQFRSDFMQHIRSGEVRIGGPQIPSSRFEAARLPKADRRSTVRWMALAAAAVILAGWLTLLSLPKRTAAFVASATPGVFLERNSNKTLLGAGMVLRTSDRILTGAGQSCEIRYRGEATRVELKANSRLQILNPRRGKRLSLLGGELAAEVFQQPLNKPMVLVTPQAAATVLGTRFTLSAKSHSTWLEVQQGAVRLIRTSDAQSLLVKAGEFGLAAEGLDLAARPVSGEVSSQGPIPVRVQLYSDSDPNNLFEVRHEFIQQSHVATAERFFGFPPLQGSYEVRVTAEILQTARNSSSRWGFVLGLARRNREQKIVGTIYSIQTSQEGRAGSRVYFAWDGRPRPEASLPFSRLRQGSYHLRLRVDFLASGKTQLRGKLWPAGDPEPEGWMLTSPPLEMAQPFNRILLATTEAAVTFRGLQIQFIE